MDTMKEAVDHPKFDPDTGPTCYPVCDTCKAPYTLKLSFIVTTSKKEWLWFRDCKHKGHHATVEFVDTES